MTKSTGGIIRTRHMNPNARIAYEKFRKLDKKVAVDSGKTNPRKANGDDEIVEYDRNDNSSERSRSGDYPHHRSSFLVVPMRDRADSRTTRNGSSRFILDKKLRNVPVCQSATKTDDNTLCKEKLIIFLAY